MKNISAQEWLNEKYPENGVCQRNLDQKNKGKKREEIIELDISRGSLGKYFYSLGDGEKNLVGSLKLEGFTNLRTLKCFGHELISLDVSECPSLEELDCQNNQLNNLNVNGCSSLEKINCDFNTSLKEVNISGCLNFAETGSGFTIENGKLVKNVPQIIPAEENSIRNVLIIGVTGSGKSALANALSSESDANQFGEKNSSTSATKSFQSSDIFEWQGKKYRVIDNIGFGDTNNVSEEEVLLRIGEGIHSAKEGINQVFFVFKDRFSPEHIMAFNLFENFISEAGIARFTTIIRTNFPKFKKEEECKKDKQDLIGQTNEINKIINSCNGIIHVDNPAIPLVDQEDSDNEEEIRIYSKKRKDSRKKVLNHLAENCSEIYKLKKWDNINSMIEDYMKRKEEIEKSDSSIKDKELKTVKTELAQGIKKEVEASIGVNVPGVPVGFSAAFKYKIN